MWSGASAIRTTCIQPYRTKHMAYRTRKVALVTGISSGIGKATATRLNASGYRVFGTLRRPTNGQAVDGIEVVEADVTNDQSVAAAVAKVMEQAGRIDVLVNNAGIGIAGG